MHRARVVGFSAIDGLLQLSLRPSIIDQKFLRASDVRVGEIIKVNLDLRITPFPMLMLMANDVEGHRKESFRCWSLCRHL